MKVSFAIKKSIKELLSKLREQQWDNRPAIWPWFLVTLNNFIMEITVPSLVAMKHSLIRYWVYWITGQLTAKHIPPLFKGETSLKNHTKCREILLPDVEGNEVLHPLGIYDLGHFLPQDPHNGPHGVLYQFLLIVHQTLYVWKQWFQSAYCFTLLMLW